VADADAVVVAVVAVVVELLEGLEGLIPLPNSVDPVACFPPVSWRAAATGTTYWCEEGDPASTCTPF
jgi:hypothetical protein